MIVLLLDVYEGFWSAPSLSSLARRASNSARVQSQPRAIGSVLMYILEPLAFNIIPLLEAYTCRLRSR